MAVLVVGLVVMVIGFALIPLPGPGWLVVFAGLAILATEFTWAEILLDRARRQASKAMKLAMRKLNSTNGASAASERPRPTEIEAKDRTNERRDDRERRSRSEDESAA